MKRKLYQVIANKVAARIRCIQSENFEWKEKHEDTIEELIKEYLPSGAGFDAGTTIDWDRSTGEVLVFHTSFHHMNEHGSYDGWTEHDVVIKPSLESSFTVKVQGRNRNNIKEYIAQVFDTTLEKEIEE
jgi:hypothetical protein